MNILENKIFEHYKVEELPLSRDCLLVNEKYRDAWAKCWAERKGEGVYGLYFVDFISVEKIHPNSLELRWFINTSTRFHAVMVDLPRPKILSAVSIPDYDVKIHIFVDSDWLEQLHRRQYAAFGMIDAIGAKEALREGRINRDNLNRLKSAVDEIAADFPQVAFISFADSLLLKGSWSVDYVRDRAPQTYPPEEMLRIFSRVAPAFLKHLGLKAYGIFTQGSNEFYQDELLHLDGPKNHVGLNALGAPFAQLMEIEEAVKSAVKRKDHPGCEVYLDRNSFASMQFKSYKDKDRPRAIYESKIMPSEGEYFYASCAEIIDRLEPDR